MTMVANVMYLAKISINIYIAHWFRNCI